MYRLGEYDRRPDADFKYDKLTHFLEHFEVQPKRAIFYDDNASVLKMALSLGIDARNAIDHNHKLSGVKSA